MKHVNVKWAFLLALIIAGALIVSYGFNRIENQQHFQNSLIHLKESQTAACHQANILRASTNVNAYAEYQAWVLVAEHSTSKDVGRLALKGVLDQTWIPLTNCRVSPRGNEGYPIPSAVRFSVRPPPSMALTVAPEDP